MKNDVLRFGCQSSQLFCDLIEETKVYFDRLNIFERQTLGLIWWPMVIEDKKDL